jgi:hypothetical protein
VKLDQENPTHRVLVALIVTGVVTFSVWGVWMTVGFVIGGTGWVFDKLGSGLLATMRAMWSVDGTVAWIGLACGAVIGMIFGLNPRVDRVWNRISRSGPVRETTVVDR